ncbi:hypothetical protein AMS68_001674 [Peltaster fructicola]|uniref:PAN2-PAN3 deadenylation complex subunit PAN3 n=1 Tax=Peltaster fructicola TaxID=286661 RepID=A0A6H0XN29_9PEZI|nr:hypothetical protein AMS68_001674 [Peltaster fructicola]
MNGANSTKKSFNVESPAFTPKSPSLQVAEVQTNRLAGISAGSAAAASFTPRGSGTVTPAASSQTKLPSNDFVSQTFQPQQAFQEFVPQNFVASSQLDSQQHLSDSYTDPFLNAGGISNIDLQQGTINPYADQTGTSTGQAFYADASQYRYPLNYHLYASFGPRREQMLPFQRTTADFFIPDDLREDLQRKAEATLQVFPNSTLPQNVDNHFHSLVALDTSAQRTSTTYGYPSWIYKATSSVDGQIYALRRIEGFRLTSEHAINTKHQWKKVCNGGIVQIHDAFTTQAFGDRSLIIVTDYFPQAQTLADKYFARHTSNTRTSQATQEQELWGFIVQLANALKIIHSNGLAARSLAPSKVLLTSKNRIRLNGCAVLDIVQYEQQRTILDLQRADLQDLGRLVLDIASRNATAHNNSARSLELISKTYSEKLLACVQWLLSPPDSTSVQQSADFNIHNLLANIADQVISTFDSVLNRDDELTQNLMKELENGRLARLVMKMNVILERPDSSPAGSNQPANTLNQPSNAWSETGERFYLKLFRDYVFHQVDHDGRPVLDLGHIVTCLNKLDAGVDERVQLTSRDEQNLFVVSYKELKRSFESAWTELSRSTHTSRR